MPNPAEDLYVLELSSYQLELTDHLACAAAVLLNLSPDHLDRHGGLGGYARAKRRIFRNQRANDWAVIGVDDDHGRDLFETLRRERDARVVPISATQHLDRGVFVERGVLYDATQGRAEGVIDLAPVESLRGTHNWQNAAAAYAAARALGVTPDHAVAGILRFRGLPHRMETIATLHRVRFVNDSKATNPDAAARSLACFDAIYWIAGGRPKEGGLDPLFPYLDRVRHAYLIGEAAAPFAEILRDRVPFTVSGDLTSAVAAAAAAARAEAAAEPVVLLAPACASFDQFASFEARGDAFRALVRELAAPAAGGRGA